MVDSSPDERARVEADRSGEPYLRYEDAAGRQRLVTLADGWRYATVGRDMGTDVCLHWDPEVSRVHARLERIGDSWCLLDDGLSRNGTFVNGERLSGTRRLDDGDELRFGNTAVEFRAPFDISQETITPGTTPVP